MKALRWSWLVAGVCVCTALPAGAQTPAGALAIDERQGDQFGWAVDYETEAEAAAAALRECGAGCSVVLTFDRCGAYAADQDPDSTAVGWGESYESAAGARQASLSECSSRGGSGCTVRVWGCNGPVAEERLGLDRAARREIQRRLQTAGFDPGGADGLFGPRTRAAIRDWQSAQGVRPTGYLNTRTASALRSAGGSGPALATLAPTAPAAAATQPPSSAGAPAEPPLAPEGLDALFWQSIMNSTNPADFDAYLEQFPSGVFRSLAQNRVAALRSSVGRSSTTSAPVAGLNPPASPTVVSGAPAPISRTATGADATPRPEATFRPRQTCPELPEGMACWVEDAQQPGCHFWNQHFRSFDSTVSATWTGDCVGGLAHGTGTIIFRWEDDGQETHTGHLDHGKKNGRWTVTRASGTVAEGLYMDGVYSGRWVEYFADGTVVEGPYVDGQRHGRWTQRDTDGTVHDVEYAAGERQGDLTQRRIVERPTRASAASRPDRPQAAAPERRRGQGSACARQRLIDLGVLNSSIQPATIQFTASRMIIIQSAGGVSTTQESEYSVTADTITYRIVRATGTAPGSGSRAIRIVNAGPHTVACSVSGRVLSFGDGTWR